MFLVVVFCCVAAATIISLARGETLVREEAVAAGHAEWMADKSGKPQFKWKEVKP
jgi:F420-0:gamma-glutamyl ligase